MVSDTDRVPSSQMTPYSVYCFECDCGRKYQTSSLKVTCSCNRVLIVEWIETVRESNGLTATTPSCDTHSKAR